MLWDSVLWDFLSCGILSGYRFGHVQRRDKDDASREILQMTVDGKQNRGRPKLRWRDLTGDRRYGQKPDDD